MAFVNVQNQNKEMGKIQKLTSRMIVEGFYVEYQNAPQTRKLQTLSHRCKDLSLRFGEAVFAWDTPTCCLSPTVRSIHGREPSPCTAYIA